MSVSPFLVVHVIPHLRGPAGELVARVAQAQHRRIPGSVAIVLARDGDESWTTTSTALVESCQLAGVAVFWCGDFFRRDPGELVAAAEAFREHVLAGRAWPIGAVVHAHTAMAAVVARKAGAPRVVATLHGVGRSRPPEFDLQDDLAWMLCDALTVPTEADAERLRARNGAAQVHVVPAAHGVDDVPLRNGPRGGHRIVHVGPLESGSDVATLVDAMPIVWQRVEDAELHLVGQGGEAGHLRTRAATLDPSGARIVVHDDSGQPTPPLEDFDVFVSANTSAVPDRDSVVAIAMGLPVVARSGGGLGALVDEARCGLVVPTGSPRDLGLGMTVLLESSPEGLMELGTKGREHVVRQFGLSGHLARLQRAYHAQADVEGQRTAVAITERPWVLPEGPVRLHLGSGDLRRPGWLNVDTRVDVAPDIVARVDALPMIGDACVDEIEACHLFEHLSLHEAHSALREWARVLKPGGRLFLELPNLDACVRILGTAVDGHGIDFGMIGIYGWPPDIEQCGVAMMHKWGWTPVTLARALEAAGFTQVEQMPVTQTYRPATKYDRDFRVGAVRADRTEAR